MSSAPVPDLPDPGRVLGPADQGLATAVLARLDQELGDQLSGLTGLEAALGERTPESTAVPGTGVPPRRPPRARNRIALVAALSVITVVIVIVAIRVLGGAKEFELGPDATPPLGYGSVTVLVSANDLAIEATHTGTQAGSYPRAARPGAADSQRWAIWYGKNAGLPREHLTLIETYASNGRADHGQGMVIEYLAPDRTALAVNRVTTDLDPATQRWTFHKDDGNWYHIANLSSSGMLCLTAVQAGSPLQALPCTDKPGQRWKLTDITEGRS